MNFADRVKETTTSTSAAVIALGGAVATFRSFASSLAVGDTAIPVSMDDGKGNWENGAYTLTNATTLTRTAIYASSNGGAPTVFPAGAKEVFCTLASEALNDLVDELRAEIGAGNSGVRDVPFAASIPLSIPGQAFMPQTPVAGPLTFTPAAAAVRGALVYLRLVADGTNLPNFTAFKEWGGSQGYDNRSGIVNEVQFFHDGVDSFVSFSQAIGAAPGPIEATAVTMTGPTGGVVNVASSVFTVGTNAARTASVTVTPTPVTGVTFNPTSVTLAAGSATATFTATPTTTGAKSIAVTNSAGLTNPSAITYTATAAATAPDAPTIGAATAGDGYVDVAFTAPANNGGSAITGYTATLSTGETATGTASPIRVTAANGTARTATVRATNSIGQGPASAASNSVTPQSAAPAVEEDGRIAMLDRAVEEGTAAPYSYYPDTTSAYGSTAPAGGMATKALQANTDGYAQFSLTAASGMEPMLALKATNAVGSLASLTYALFCRSGSTYAIYSAGTFVSSATLTNSVSRMAGDKVRMRRTGTMIVAEVQRSAETTWTEIYNWTGVPTGVLYFAIPMAGAANTTTRITSVRFLGLV